MYQISSFLENLYQLQETYINLPPDHAMPAQASSSDSREPTNYIADELIGIELTEVMWQRGDPLLLDMLNKIRMDEIDDDSEKKKS